MFERGRGKYENVRRCTGSRVILTCRSVAAQIGSTVSRGRAAPSDSVAFADLPHPLDLALNDLGLADVPARVEAPRDEGQSLLGDRLGVLKVRRDANDRERPRGRRVQVSAFLVDARVVEFRPRAANAFFVDLELLPRLRRRLAGGAIEVLVGEEWQPVFRVAVRAHAPRVRSLVPLIRALVILGQRHREEHPAVADRLEGDLLPHEFFLDQEPRGAADLLLEDLAAVRQRLRLAREMIAPDAHPCAARQAERLDHELEVGVAHELFETSEIVERPELWYPGNVMLSHQGPREFLVRLELSRFLGRTNRRNRGGLERIRDAFLERRLGSDHREFDAVPLPPRDDALDVGHVPEEDVLRAPTDARILVRHGGVDVRLASMERFDDRMLAASAPDHQHLHNPMQSNWLSGFL